MHKERQVSESFTLGAILAVVGGFLDAYTYLLRGNVFANAQTGNIVLMGISLTKGEIGAAILYLLPIGAFGFGVILSEIIRRRYFFYPPMFALASDSDFAGNSHIAGSRLYAPGELGYMGQHYDFLPMRYAGGSLS